MTIVQRELGWGVEVCWYRGSVLLSRLVLTDRFLTSVDRLPTPADLLNDDNGSVMDA